MKNTTLAMVAVLVAVTMLSAVLAVAPMQEVNAEKRDGKDKDGNNKVIIKQSNKCKEVEDACTNELFGMITQNSGEDGVVSDMVE